MEDAEFSVRSGGLCTSPSWMRSNNSNSNANSSLKGFYDSVLNGEYRKAVGQPDSPFYVVLRLERACGFAVYDQFGVFTKDVVYGKWPSPSLLQQNVYHHKAMVFAYRYVLGWICFFSRDIIRVPFLRGS